MANAIGTLSIDVLANIAGMVSDLGKAQAANAKTAAAFQADWESAIGGVQDAFGSLAEMAGVGLSIAGLAEVAQQALDTAETVQNMAQVFGLSTQAIQTMGYAAALVGGDVDSAGTALQRMVKSAEMAGAGSKQQMEAFNALGISAAQLPALLANPDQLLQTLAQHVAQYGSGLGLAAAVQEIFGRGGATMIPMLVAMGQNFAELQQHAIDLGVVLSGADQTALADTKASLNELKEAVVGIGNQFTIAMLPAINAVIAGLTDLAENSNVRAFFQALGADVGQFVIEAQTVGSTVAGWITDFKDVVSSMDSLSDAFGFIANPIKTVFGLLGSVVDEFHTLSGASQSATGEIKNDVAGWVQWIKDEKEIVANDFANLWLMLESNSVVVWNKMEQIAVGYFVFVASAAAKLADTLSGVGALSNFFGGPSFESSVAKFTAGMTVASTDVSSYTKEIAGNNAALAASLAQNATDAAGMRITADAYNLLTNASGNYAASLTKGDVVGNTQKLAVAEAAVHAMAVQMVADGADQTKTNAAEVDALKALTATTQNADAAQVMYNAKVSTAKDVADNSVKALQALQLVIDGLSSKAGDEYTKAWDTYEDAMTKVIDAVNKAEASGQNLAAVQALEAQGMASANTAYQNRVQVLQALEKIQQTVGDSVQQLEANYAAETDDLTLNADQRAKVTAELAAEKQMRDAVKAAVTAGHIVYAQEETDLIALAKAHADEVVQAKADQAAMAEWQSIAVAGLDSVGTSIANFITTSGASWKSFGAMLVSDTRQFIAAIIAEFLKLEVFNGIINSLFGSNLPTGVGGILGSLFGGGSAIAESSAGIGADIGAGLSGDIATDVSAGGIMGSSAASSLTGITTLDSAASTTNGLMGYLFGTSNGLVPDQFVANSSLGNAIMGSDDLAPFESADTGVPDVDLAVTGDYGTAAGSSSGLFGQLAGPLAIVGAGLAALNEFNAAGGGAGGVAGGAAYGTAAYFAGAAVAAGLSAGIAGGVSLGVSAAFDAIPVVGWVALAATVLNMATGGGLFGTAAKPYAGTESIAFGTSSASIQDAEVSKGKKPLFGGSYYTTTDEAVPAAAATAIGSLFSGMQTDIAVAATALGTTVGPLITGSFYEVFNTAGTMTSEVSTVLGQQYTDTLQQFVERVTADNLIALLPAAQNASAIAAQWQSSADTLLDGSEMLLAAQVDVNKGMGLLGSSDSSLADIASTVQSLEQSGESMLAAYQRLQAEQEDLTGTLTELGLSTGKTGVAFVTFADQLTQAAGGLTNLDTLWSDYYKNFYNAAQQSAGALTSVQTTAAQALSEIGESSTVTMAQFKIDFQNALPNLTPAQVVMWLQAAEALEAVNTQLTAIAAANQKYADYEVQTQGDAFEQAMTGVIEGENAQIANANALAIAAGKAGASTQDLAVIMTAGSATLATAIATLTSGIVADINTLYGSPIAESSASDPDGMFLIQDGTAAAKQAAAQAHADALSTGSDLIQKLGDYMFASGDTVDEALKAFGLTTAQLGTTMGLSPAAIAKQIQVAEQQAAALVTMASQGVTQTGLLTDILAALQGKPLPFNLASLVAPVGYTPPGLYPHPIVNRPDGTPVPTTSTDVVAQMKSGTNDVKTQTAQLSTMNATLAKIYRGGGRSGLRNTRGNSSMPAGLIAAQ
jgi:hypothetical protein